LEDRADSEPAFSKQSESVKYRRILVGGRIDHHEACRCSTSACFAAPSGIATQAKRQSVVPTELKCIAIIRGRVRHQVEAAIRMNIDCFHFLLENL
jgi:hypothetical protein